MCREGGGGGGGQKSVFDDSIYRADIIYDKRATCGGIFSISVLLEFVVESMSQIQ